MSEVTLIVGIHRCGSSCIAGILHKLGLYMGEPDTAVEVDRYDGWPSSPSNRRGQYEDHRFVHLFAQTQGNWRSPQGLLVSDEQQLELARLIKDNNDNHDKWGLKTPQLAFALKWLLENLSEVKIIVVQRAFEHCVNSLVKRDDFPKEVANYLQSNYFMALHANLALAQNSGVPIMEIAYPQTVKDPEYVIHKLAGFVGLSLDNKQEAMNFVERSLCHHK